MEYVGEYKERVSVVQFHLWPPQIS